jgi:OmpA family
MPDFILRKGEYKRPLAVATGETHKVTIRWPKSMHLLEMEDAHFHHDSAVLLPDYAGSLSEEDEESPDRAMGLAVLRAALAQAAENPKQKLLIAGHTDTTGQPDYNVDLSQQRADSVLHVLCGNKDDWVTVAHGKHKTEDYQQIFKWAARQFGWDCDPGAVDDKDGPKTKAATKEFQKGYNVDFEQSIDEDGIVGKQTWGAVFDCYEQVLGEVLFDPEESSLADRRGKIVFLDDPLPKNKGFGENYPIEEKEKDNYNSAVNRRVELLFFDPGEEPKEGQLELEGCKLYDPLVYGRNYIQVFPLPGTPVRIGLTFVDELGEPLKETEVTLTFANGAQSSLTTNDAGKITAQVIEGMAFEMEIADVQEFSTTLGGGTFSGTHLAPEGSGEGSDDDGDSDSDSGAEG